MKHERMALEVMTWRMPSSLMNFVSISLRIAVPDASERKPPFSMRPVVQGTEKLMNVMVPKDSASRWNLFPWPFRGVVRMTNLPYQYQAQAEVVQRDGVYSLLVIR